MFKKKYTKKPVTVQAVQWGGSDEQAQEIVSWLNSNTGQKARFEAIHPRRLVITTLEGEFDLKAGWWIIEGVKGEIYGCRDDIFQETYGPAKEPAKKKEPVKKAEKLEKLSEAAALVSVDEAAAAQALTEANKIK